MSQEYTPSFPVVGIGASAGGLQPLQRFLAALPVDSGMAFVVVTHLAPQHESHLAAVLQPHTSMPVRQVQETTPLEPDHIYVIPPNRNLTSIDTQLRLAPLAPERGDRAPIDHFLRTLAQSHGEQAIGVLLSGTGSDGTIGLKWIKERGGLTVVQEPTEAAFDGMPQSAIATGLMDLVLPVHEMPAQIVNFVRRRPTLVLPDGDEAPVEDEQSLLYSILRQLQEQTGLDFSRYKPTTLLRRLQRRLQIHHLDTLADYLRLLHQWPHEATLLARDLLISVTNFFRDPEVFNHLSQTVIPALFAGKRPDQSIRIWVAGCATGEEAYSLGILLLEYARQLNHPPPVQIFASDLNETALVQAREGLYPAVIASDVSPERLATFFDKDQGGYRVRKELREIITFAHHNLLQDPPFSKVDLITCRNVLIYLQRPAQQLLFEVFHYALRPEGYLLLGEAERVDNSDLFQELSKPHSLYRRQPTPGAGLRLPLFPAPLPTALLGRAWMPSDPLPALSAGSLHHRMVELYAPPSLLVNRDYTILHLSEHAGRYLQQLGGTPTNHLLQRIRPELRVELATALYAALAERRPTRVKPIPLEMVGGRRQVGFNVYPAVESDLQEYVLVIFEESAVEAEAAETAPAPTVAVDRIRELEAELAWTKQRLSIAIEEFESAKEEMRATNEELLSMNEELKTSTEELATSKEELQSVNEELLTANQENQNRLEELSQLSNDLQNLLAATNIATLFLDQELRILRFTPQVERLFNLLLSDRGRPLAHVTHKLGDLRLLDEAAQVLRTQTPITREVRSEDGGAYLMQVLPYHTAAHQVRGVVLTFVDLTALKQVETALRESEERYRLLVENTREYAIFTLDAAGCITSWNPGAERVCGFREAEALGQPSDLIFTPEDRAAGAPAQELTTARAQGQALDERWHLRQDGSRFWGSGVMMALYDETGGLRGFAKVLRDLTEQKQAEAALQESQAQLQTLNTQLEARVQAQTAQLREVASQLTRAEQAERRRIAQILHDDLQQRLFGTRMLLKIITEETDGDPESELAEYAQQAYGLLGDAIGLTRQLTVDLSPPVLKEEGLTDMLSWLATQMARQHNFQVAVQAAHNFPIADADMRVLLFQCVRELLFNVVKHAQTDRASVSLAAGAESHLVIQISDKGRGFDVAAAEARYDGGFGLFSVRERLALFGGRMAIDSAPGQGTHITLNVPLGLSQADDNGTSDGPVPAHQQDA
jgi:two-component system, chemotaxis family, CheB/CheR fusion protein